VRRGPRRRPEGRTASTSTSPTPSSAWAKPKVVEERYGNLFDMYERITGENPYRVPMRIYPAVHYTMGGLWVDYNLMSTIPGCSCSARPTSPTTAPTASAPRR
jgi:succinate dehydrogenase/fumarate reductase flavoprotein subunit